MHIKLLMAASDRDYVEHLSNYLAEKYAETFELSVCSSADRLRDLLAANRFDVALLEPSFTVAVNFNANAIRLPLVLVDETGILPEDCTDMEKMRKYQRISSLVGNILEICAETSVGTQGYASGKARITVVWSPCGGVGKTTVALAYAARNVSAGKEAVYLDLEDFSSTPVYFSGSGKSISTAFEKLDLNVHMVLMGIRQLDTGSGITYFLGPDNYDDMNILTIDDIETLISACATGTDELIIDLSSRCDEKVQMLFDLSDTVFIVNDPSVTAQAKLKQFISQHNVAQRIQHKCVLVNNKGAKTKDIGINKTIDLPTVHSSDPVSVYKTLSGSHFEW